MQPCTSIYRKSAMWLMNCTNFITSKSCQLKPLSLAQTYISTHSYKTSGQYNMYIFFSYII